MLPTSMSFSLSQPITMCCCADRDGSPLTSCTADAEDKRRDLETCDITVYSPKLSPSSSGIVVASWSLVLSSVFVYPGQIWWSISSGYLIHLVPVTMRTTLPNAVSRRVSMVNITSDEYWRVFSVFMSCAISAKIDKRQSMKRCDLESKESYIALSEWRIIYISLLI